MSLCRPELRLGLGRVEVVKCLSLLNDQQRLVVDAER